MKLLEKEDFTNVNKDRVIITLFEDSAHGFHLIVKCSRYRQTEEPRLHKGELVRLPLSEYTEETKIIQLFELGIALNEFNLYRVLESDPGYSSADYSQWQATQKESN